MMLLCTSTPTSASDVISTVEVQISLTSTPVSIPRNIVQWRLSMSDSSITTAVHQGSVTINDNWVTNSISEVTPRCLTQDNDDDDNGIDESDSDSDSPGSILSD